MTNKNINSLTAATTPLAGTELVPIWDGASKKVTVAKILTPAAGHGIDYSANTPSAGVTSQLLNWYEEGTWTPGFAAWTTAPTFSDARYIRIGKQVTVIILGQSGVNAGNQAVTGLPFINSNGVCPTGALKIFGASTLSSLCNINTSSSDINSFSPMTLTGNYWSLSITYFMTF